MRPDHVFEGCKFELKASQAVLFSKDHMLKYHGRDKKN